MIITGQRIKLTPFDRSDRDLFIEMSMCPQMMKHVVEPCSYDEAKLVFDTKSTPWYEGSDGWLSLGITEMSTGDKLENIGVKIVNHHARIADSSFFGSNGLENKEVVLQFRLR